MLRGLGYGMIFVLGWPTTSTPKPFRESTRVAIFGYANGSRVSIGADRGRKNFVLKPHMAPLEAVRDDIRGVLKNLTLTRDPGNAHRSASYSVFGLGAPTSIDQEFAKFLEDTTPLASLEIAVRSDVRRRRRHPGLSQVDGRFIPSVKNPLAAYQRIADRISGGGMSMSTPSAAEQALLRRQSVLDFIKDDVRSFRGRLGPAEAVKMDFYLESLRTLERGVGGSTPQRARARRSSRRCSARTP